MSALPPEQVLQAVREGRLELLDLRSGPERRLLDRPPGARPVRLLRHLLRPAGPGTGRRRLRAWRRQGLPTER